MDRRSKGYLMVAAAIALVAVGVAVWALFFRDPSPAPAPDIAPPVEDNALPTGDQLHYGFHFIERQTAPGPGRRGGEHHLF